MTRQPSGASRAGGEPPTGAQQLHIEHVPIDTLRPDPANPRRISDAELEALTRSIREFGMVDPVIARREDRVVIGGHQRLLAARRLAMKTVPVILLDLSPEQAHLLSVALNKINGTWDEELLAHLLADLQPVTDLDLTLSGFAADEIEALLKSLDARDRRDRVETFDLEQAIADAGKAPARTQHGDVWLCGDHRIGCADRTDGAAVARLLGGQRAQLAFTDPPYNVDYGNHGGQQRGSRKRSIANDAMPPEQWNAFVHGWMGNLLSSVDGAIYIAMSSSEMHTVRAIFDELGGHWSDYVVWAKDRFVLGRADFQRQYEMLLYGWREGAKHYWCGDRDQGDVWEIPRPLDSELHPTMKPLELVERAIENSSRPGDIVMDLFLGSGTTLIAAERTGRTCIAAELDPKYCDIAVARWESLSGGTATREASGR